MSTLKKTVAAVATAAAAALLLAACSGGNSGGGDGGHAPLVFGTLLPETGAAAALGPSMITGSQLAIEDINAAGGVLGSEVTLEGTDSSDDPAVATAGFDQLISRGVNVVLGTASSSMSLAVLDKAVGSGVLMCSGANTSTDFTTYPHEGYYFRTSASAPLEATALVKMISEEGDERIALIGRADSFGKPFLDALEEAAENFDVEVTTRIEYDPATTNFDAEITQIQGTDPDAIVVIGYVEQAKIAQTALERGLTQANGVNMYGINQMADNGLWERIDPSNQSVAAGFMGVTNPEGIDPDFTKRVLAENPKLTQATYSAEQYDCAIIAALAATAADSTVPSEFKAQVSAVTTGDTECNTYADCLELLADGKSIAYAGKAGPLRIDENGDPTIGRFSTWVLDDMSQVKTTGEVSCTKDSCE